MNVFRIFALALLFAITACSADEPQSTGVPIPTPAEAQTADQNDNGVANDALTGAATEEATISAGEDVDSAAEPVSAANEIVLAQADTTGKKWSSANFRRRGWRSRCGRRHRLCDLRRNDA